MQGSKATRSTKDEEVDILVVGAGVTGLTLAMLLSRWNVRTLVIARHSGTAPSPRAHVTNMRTMEIFRDAGILDRVESASESLPDLGNSVITTGILDPEIARYRCYGGGPSQLADFQEASPCKMVNSPQHVLEPILLDTARERGADVRFSNELIDLDESASGIVARVRGRSTGDEYQVRARYIVGADGGRSFVARKAGFEFHGQHDLTAMSTAWIEADLTQHVDYRPSCIYWIVKPGNAHWVGSATLIIVKPFKEWVFNWQHTSKEEQDTSDAAVIDRVRSVLGIQDLAVKVKSVSKWQVNNVFAKKYRQGKVFLAGDAAHRHPPSSGLGSNTCVQDAHNLAWKLALVVTGKAEDSLLDTYNQERQPVGEFIVGHAIQSMEKMIEVPRVLGFEDIKSEEEGRKKLEELFSDSPGAEDRRAALANVIDLQNFRSNAIGLHLGHRYEKSYAVIDDGTPFPKRKRDPILYYEPTTHPGAYLPHAWIQHGKQLVSTLDMFVSGQFGLIIGIGGEPWVAAAAKASEVFGIEIPVYKVGARCPYDDVYLEWQTRREVTDRGALLVRPDRHIAWRCLDRPHVDPAEALQSAFNQLLGRPVA